MLFRSGDVADDSYAAQLDTDEGAFMGRVDGQIASLARIRLFSLPRRIKVKQRELRVNRPVHMAVQHLPRPGNRGVVEQEGGAELERGVGASNAEDSPAKENPSGLKFQQALAKLGVDGICIPGLAFDCECEIPGHGRLAEMPDDI